MTGLSQPAFQVSVPGLPMVADELGLWGSAQVLETDNDFTITNEQAGEWSVWRIELPTAECQALALLDAGQVRLRLASQGLSQATGRLERFLETAYESNQEFYFGIEASTDPRFEPERQLVGWLGMVTAEDSFGLAEGLRSGWDETTRQAMAFFERVKKCLSRYALVRSVIEGQILACTSVGWLGDFDTLWRNRSTQAHATYHTRSLGLALETRQAWLHLSTLVTSGAVQLALLTSTLPVAAVPAAWKFYKQILEQVCELKELRHQTLDK